MRNSFIDTLTSQADERTMLLVGDVGYSVVERFAERFPRQFLNVGVAEQVMTGMAAGLALEGHKVFTYSIANFSTLRPIEQIRNDICYHNLDVTIVSVGGGFVYGSAGYSHHAVQDIGMMASLPHMIILLPANAPEATYCMNYACAHGGPKYLRLGKNDNGGTLDVSPLSSVRYHVGDMSAKVAIVSVGGILDVALEAGALMMDAGLASACYSVPVIDVHFAETIRERLLPHKVIVTLEESIPQCGFGSIVREALEGTGKRVVTLGAKRDNHTVVGDQHYMRKMHGIDACGVVRAIMEVCDV